MDFKEFDRKFDSFVRASAISNKHICWTCILRFIDQNWLELEVHNAFGTNSGDRVVKFCLDVLMEHDCSDKTFLYSLLEIYFRWHFHDCNRADKGPEAEYMVEVMKPLKVLESRHENKPLILLNLETLPICVTDEKFMLILSKYGIGTERSVFNVSNAKKTFKRFMLCIPQNERLRHSCPRELSKIASRIQSIFVQNDGGMPLSKNQRGLQYFFLMIRVLHAVSLDLEGSPFTDNFIKCLKIFYRTVTIPFVCQKDVKEFLRFLWFLLPFRLLSLVTITDIYTRLFKDETPWLYSPRSLKHLSRVTVRNTLRMNGKMLPQSVRSLHIPRDLHDYLLCIEPLHM